MHATTQGSIQRGAKAKALVTIGHIVLGASLLLANGQAFGSETAQVAPVAPARESTKQEFQQAVLDLQKALIVQGVYDAVYLEPERCAATTARATANLADEISRRYPELISLVEASPLLPSLKEGLLSDSTAPLPQRESFEMCSEIAAMLLELLDDKNGKQQVEQMVWTLKQ